MHSVPLGRSPSVAAADFKDEHPHVGHVVPATAPKCTFFKLLLFYSFLASPVPIRKRKFNFEHAEHPDQDSQRKKLAVKVGKRFIDASLRKQAIDTFQFRPLPQEISSGFAVDWPPKKPEQIATPGVSALKSLQRYFSPSWL